MGVGVWVCGCVGVWVCGCVGVWVCGCVGVWVGVDVFFGVRGSRVLAVVVVVPSPVPRTPTRRPQAHPLGIKTAQKPYIVWSLGPKALYSMVFGPNSLNI